MIELPDRLTAAQFSALVRREHEHLELKSGAGRKPLGATMVAFTNTEGGAILIGVGDDRVVHGRARDQGLDDDVHGAAGDAHSVGRYEIREIQVADKPVVAVLVHPRRDAVAQTSDGRVLVRRGGHNVAPLGRELHELITSRSLIRFEETDSGVAPSRVGTAQAEALATVCGYQRNGEELDRWRERGLLTEAGKLTIAGALVLTDPAKTLRSAKFCVDIRAYEHPSASSYLRRETITGTVVDQVARSTEIVLRDIGTESIVTGAYRHDLPRLPQRAIREVIANAVAHRSYESDTTPIVVELRPTSLIVTSPGPLPPPVTIETLRQAQSPRNHTVIAILRRFGLAEDSGQGIDVIQDEMRWELLDEPIFTESTDSFRVELPLQGLISTTERAWLSEFERTGRLDPADRTILLRILRDDRVTNSRIRDLTGLDSTQARAGLQRLRDAGLAIQHGTRGRAYYALGTIGPRASDRDVVLTAAAAGSLTNERVRELTGLDRAGARALLKQLVTDGLLDQRGERRGTTYALARRRPKRRE